MPITEITYQPIENSLNAAFASIAYRCKAKIPNASFANYICPVVFCDIYVEGIYYKTLSRSQYISNDGVAPEYEFDIQDAIQELMDYNLPKMEGTTIEQFNNTIKKVFVKFRNAFLDSNGFSISEQFAPVQGTSSTSPIAGGGILSKNIFVLNSVIQHEENQEFEKLLDSYKTGIWNNAFPLTKRPEEFKICKTDSSHFPIVSDLRPKQICIKAKMKSGEIIDLCNELLESCPKLENIQYTVTYDIPNNVEVFVFTWTNPINLPPMPYEIKIYRRLHGTNDPWNTTSITVFPNPITSQQVILPLGYYDFVFEILGTCQGLSFGELPSLNNIGSTGQEPDNPPVIVIKWNDNNGNEVRTCTQSVCNFTIKVDATDLDNDIVNIQILKSINNGVTWNSFISHLLADTFTDSINTSGTQLYKAIVIDANNNQAESNVLSYAKQQELKPIYRKYITGITCVGNGDGPTNYDVWCTGMIDFALSDNNLLAVNYGFIRMTVDGGSFEIGLSKSGGGVLVLNEVLQITSLLTASYGAVGQNPPSAYPNGYPANATAAVYTFEYSLDGVNAWTSFQLSVDD